jgi:hypothetical protein
MATHGAARAFGRRPLPRASRPLIGPILKGSKGSDLARSLGCLAMPVPCELPSPIVSPRTTAFSPTRARTRIGFGLSVQAVGAKGRTRSSARAVGGAVSEGPSRTAHTVAEDWSGPLIDETQRQSITLLRPRPMTRNISFALTEKTAIPLSQPARRDQRHSPP